MNKIIIIFLIYSFAFFSNISARSGLKFKIGLHTGGFYTVVNSTPKSKYLFMQTSPHVSIVLSKNMDLGLYLNIENFRGTNLPSINGLGIGIIFRYEWFNANFINNKHKFSFGSTAIIYMSQVRITETNNLPLYVKSKQFENLYTYILPLGIRLKINNKINIEGSLGIRQAEEFAIQPAGKFGLQYLLYK